MNDEQIKAAKAAWQRDPDTAAKALLGMIAEEVFIQAIRGCNQHAHKPGCPDYDGRSAADAQRLAELEEEIKKSGAEKARALENRKSKKGKEAYSLAVAKDNKLRRERNELLERQQAREAVAKSDDPEKAALAFLDSEKSKLQRKLNEAVEEMQSFDKFMYEAEHKGGMKREEVEKLYGEPLKKASAKVSALDAAFKDMVARWDAQGRKMSHRK